MTTTIGRWTRCSLPAQTLDGWVAPDGTPPGYSELPLLPGELLPEGGRWKARSRMISRRG